MVDRGKINKGKRILLTMPPFSTTLAKAWAVEEEKKLITTKPVNAAST